MEAKGLGFCHGFNAKDAIKKGRIPSNAALPGFLPGNPEAARNEKAD